MRDKTLSLCLKKATYFFFFFLMNYNCLNIEVCFWINLWGILSLLRQELQICDRKVVLSQKSFAILSTKTFVLLDILYCKKFVSLFVFLKSFKFMLTIFSLFDAMKIHRILLVARMFFLTYWRGTQKLALAKFDNQFQKFSLRIFMQLFLTTYKVRDLNKKSSITSKILEITKSIKLKFAPPTCFYKWKWDVMLYTCSFDWNLICVR